MNSIKIFFSCCIVFGFLSCSEDDPGKYADYLVARPLTITLQEFKNGVEVVSPKPIAESGKIYAYQDYIFVNDKFKGVHVIDNTNPASPRKVAFIKIAGNVDISVKNNFLYADSLTDLIVLDISDINNIQIVNRLQNVLRDNVVWPLEADIFEYDDWGNPDNVLIGWEVVTERRLIDEVPQRFEDVMMANAAENSVGQGGSLARFKIVADYLYAVDSHSINIFEISDLANPVDMEDVYAGFDIETIFNRGDQLFLGSRSGMYIYDITEPSNPSFISEFQHGTACDPVVVDGDYAYITLRGGNGCGATESGLFLVDISDISNPSLTASYPMEEPYGLGIRDNKLFVCDGSFGLRVYDTTNVPDLVALQHFEDITTFDVIPLQEHLLMVGEETLYQYSYNDVSLELISSMSLN
ncbi:LVIVD repeat-containing protein [Muriicola sp.]|uniref:LVIVD repeat-containing protein n=1 Tax=Muriicola sp. TaxID=2020856 RepID=UPI003C72D798